MLTLYYAPHTCALASHIALEEAGATYDSVRLSFKSGDQRKPDYLKINPKARVPSLVTDRGIITETPALLIYIAQTFPAAKLAPLDDPVRARQGAGVQQLPLLDRARRARAPHAREPLGRRAGGAPRDAAQGAAGGRRLFRADRARDVRRAVGDGQRLHGLRRLPVHAVAMACRRRRRHRHGRRRSPSTSGGSGSVRRCARRSRTRRVR